MERETDNRRIAAGGGQYRNELKYICTPGQWAVVENGLRRLMRPDIHAGDNGSYRIRSLYFDDQSDTCFYENENGTDPREKFRLRIYDGNGERIALELKRKERGRTRKLSCLVDREDAGRMLRGGSFPVRNTNPPLLSRFAMETRRRLLRPKVIVEYDRIAYVMTDGNVRITFDRDICSSSGIGLFFQESLPRRPIMPAGRHILEVKYDGFLPDAVYHLLQSGELRRTGYSKYYLCRKYSLGGKENYGI